MGGADSYSVTLLGARSRGLDGSLGRCNASAVGSRLVHNGTINNPANAVVEIRGRASFTLANGLPQSANDEFSVRSKVRIAESSDGQFGTDKFKELQFFGPSLEGEYAETVAIESYEVGTANDISTVVRNRTAVGEQGDDATEGSARNSASRCGRRSLDARGLQRKRAIAGNGSDQTTPALASVFTLACRRYLTPHSPRTTSVHLWRG
jgi:hypothetical protein